MLPISLSFVPTSKFKLLSPFARRRYSLNFSSSTHVVVTSAVYITGYFVSLAHSRRLMARFTGLARRSTQRRHVDPRARGGPALVRVANLGRYFLRSLPVLQLRQKMPCYPQIHIHSHLGFHTTTGSPQCYAQTNRPTECTPQFEAYLQCHHHTTAARLSA